MVPKDVQVLVFGLVNMFPYMEEKTSHQRRRCDDRGRMWSDVLLEEWEEGVMNQRMQTTLEKARKLIPS